ncbi:addiction module toxin, HicA family [Candidatus Jorgensenbacteria bacterium GWA1_54_12]|uniref:Addiction module toxin, HicA family n=1 Tax=Candidatus Jorgensenbacteria bacterium GWA1_54_12 TaxID=1798468 RepID=A0A1F6BL56_9BACT|nr:MAG: addiction module toxin, HicA family [Candidatus Jorgensenbacteria bacterium GWA1_54_12]
MKRLALLKYLHGRGCLLIREGKKHSLVLNPDLRRISTVPRHREINDFLAEKICRDLGVLRASKS